MQCPAPALTHVLPLGAVLCRTLLCPASCVCCAVSPQTLQQFEEEQNAVPGGGADTFNPFEAPAYAAGGSRGKGKGVTGE